MYKAMHRILCWKRDIVKKYNTEKKNFIQKMFLQYIFTNLIVNKIVF